MLKKYLLALSLTLPLQLSAWTYNSSYDNDGVPITNLASPAIDLDQSVLDTMLSALKEGSRAHVAHPEYFPDSDPEIIINPDTTSTTEVFVTFYSEGAGYKNSLGYYAYEGDQRPTKAEAIENGVIIFPNMSLPNKGGNLQTRTTVKLDRDFDPGTKIHFFLIANGWTGGGTVTTNTNNLYSTDSGINPEGSSQTVTKNGKTYTIPDSKHVAMLWNQIDNDGNGILLMGYEDIRRPGGDNDFNDALFAISTSPLEDLKDTVTVANENNESNETGLVTITAVNNDTDGDGIFNSFDAYPDDENRSSNSYYPSESGVATLSFEDQWPSKGDYDLNDLVVAFNIHEVKDADNKVKDITITGTFKAYGAGYKNGLAFAIDTPRDNIESLEFFIDGEKDILSEDHAIKEDAVDSTAIINVSSNARSYFYDISGSDYDKKVNTEDFQADGSNYASKTFSITLTLKESAAVMKAPYNPFLYRNNGEIEVHLPGYKPTGNAAPALFGTEDDHSEEYYLSKINREPWALLIPTEFAHPREKVKLYDAYLKFGSWVESAGGSDGNWFDAINNPSFVDLPKVVR